MGQFQETRPKKRSTILYQKFYQLARCGTKLATHSNGWGNGWGGYFYNIWKIMTKKGDFTLTDEQKYIKRKATCTVSFAVISMVFLLGWLTTFVLYLYGVAVEWDPVARLGDEFGQFTIFFLTVGIFFGAW